MKVKCIKNRTEKDKLYDILIGKDYIVLEIEFSSKGSTYTKLFNDFIQYRIVDINGIMMPIPSNLFEIVDNSIPDNWIFNKVNNDLIELMPKEFFYDNFLEDYYDGDPAAVNIVKGQLKNYKDVN